MATSSASAPARTPEGADTPWWKRWWVILLAFPAVALVIGGLLLFFFFFAAVPLPEDVGASPTVVLDAAGNEFGTLNPQAARQDIAIDTLPEHVPFAVMSAEDRGFEEHGGISITGVARALFANAKAGGVTQGGSTITQQYVKNALPGVGNDRTFLRKAKEASLAIKLEQRFDKTKILEMYLNTIYWGRGAYGIEAASQTYFAKPAADLSVNEATTLAGIIQQPENLDPAENPEGAVRRRDYVVNGMVEEGWLDSAAAQEVTAAPAPETTSRQNVEFGEGAYYLDAVKRELSRVLGDKEVYTGLTVRTELDRDFQLAAESAMKEALDGKSYTGALVSIDPRSGGVRALVGGPDFAEQQLNTAVRSARQVGSSFKPFTLTSFVEAGYSPESRFEAPATITVPSGGGDGTADISNYDREDHGVEDLYEATRRSTNTVYVQVQDAVGTGDVQDTASKLGLPRERINADGETVATMPSEASLTLGVGSFTPLEMTSAYATLAAGGVHTTPHLVVEVTNNEGDIVYTADVQQDARIKANDAYIVTDVLRGVIDNGTGTAAQIGRPAAGKTGTTNDYTDAWFAGYVPQLATSVWIGNLDNSPMEDQITGGSVPAQTWAAYMSAALEKVEVEDFPAPDLAGKEILNGKPEPEPTETETETECPEPGEDGSVVDAVLGAGTEAPKEGAPADCPDASPSPTESPTESPSPSESPTPSSSPTSKPTSEPTTEPTSEPTAEPTSEPAPDPTLSPQSSGDGTGATPEPEPTPTPTG